MKASCQDILYSWYCIGYKEAIEGKKPRIFKFVIYTYFAQDIVWAYEKGYSAGLIDRDKKKFHSR